MFSGILTMNCLRIMYRIAHLLAHLRVVMARLRARCCNGWHSVSFAVVSSNVLSSHGRPLKMLLVSCLAACCCSYVNCYAHSAKPTPEPCRLVHWFFGILGVWTCEQLC